MPPMLLPWTWSGQYDTTRPAQESVAVLPHPVAVRLICWFPPEADTVVVTLFAADKATIGDVFYNSVANRADPLIDQCKRENAQEAES
jgi:hypothetical protein